MMITVVKTSSNATAVANNNCYSLAGTTYGLYTSNGTLVHTFVINASGTTDTFKITDMTKSYYVQEITAGPGYALDKPFLVYLAVDYMFHYTIMAGRVISPACIFLR